MRVNSLFIFQFFICIAAHHNKYIWGHFACWASLSSAFYQLPSTDATVRRINAFKQQERRETETSGTSRFLKLKGGVSTIWPKIKMPWWVKWEDEPKTRNTTAWDAVLVKTFYTCPSDWCSIYRLPCTDLSYIIERRQPSHLNAPVHSELPNAYSLTHSLTL